VKTALCARAIAALIVLADYSYAAVLHCPATAPQAWKVGPSPLADVRVLSYPAADKVDHSGTLPIMVPDKQENRGGTFYQTWLMNTDAPTFTFEFLCLYKNVERQLVIAAPGVKRCVLASSNVRVVKFECR